MLELQTELEGKRTHFGEFLNLIEPKGYHLGGGWDYHSGCFDSILHREGGETIYLRMPFLVRDGILDDQYAGIEFTKPYVIKHVVNVGLDSDMSSLGTATFNQFQEPFDKDATIHDKSKWALAGEQAIEEIIPYLQ